MRLIKKDNKKVESKIQELKQELEDTKNKITELERHKGDIEKEILNCEIAPFKIGDYALVEITIGKKKQWKKCLLENVRGTLYVRPFKSDGDLSLQHYSLIALDYSDLLKPVED